MKINVEINLEHFRYSLVGDGYILSEAEALTDQELEEIFKAEAILDDYVKAKETARPEKYWAVCPDCGHELEYEHFQYESCDEDKVHFFANGTCISCGRNFDWCETFELIGIDFDEEIDEE
jgi:DNA-directed RNA polymerase subunit M/transcription elongation factor TFIIS